MPGKWMRLLRENLRYRLMVVTFLSVAMSVIAYTGVILWLGVDTRSAQLHDEAAALATRLASSLDTDLVHGDPALMAAMVGSAALHPRLVSIKVFPGVAKAPIEVAGHLPLGPRAFSVRQSIPGRTDERWDLSRAVTVTMAPPDWQEIAAQEFPHTLIGALIMALAGMLGVVLVLRRTREPLQDIFTALDKLAGDDTRIHLSGLGRPDEFGRVSAALMRFRDVIVERRQAEHSVRREKKRLRAFLQTASEGIHVVDKDGLLIEANRAFLDMLEMDESVIGHLYVADWDVGLGAQVGRQVSERILAGRRNSPGDPGGAPGRAR